MIDDCISRLITAKRTGCYHIAFWFFGFVLERFSQRKTSTVNSVNVKKYHATKPNERTVSETILLAHLDALMKDLKAKSFSSTVADGSNKKRRNTN